MDGEGEAYDDVDALGEAPVADDGDPSPHLLGAVAGSFAYEREECVELSDDGPRGTLKPRVEVLARGLEVPWDIAFLPSGDMLVTERAGRLRLISKRGGRGRAVLRVTVADQAAPLGPESGLLGVVIHPNFALNRLFYLYYTGVGDNGEPVSRLARYRLSLFGLSAKLDRILLDNIPAGPYHQGGRMRIGPDGMLYVGVGTHEPSLAQQPDKLNGKILRMTLDGKVPADNPTPGSLVFARGVRNAQAFDWFDSDHMLVMDHGPTAIDPGIPLTGLDELNVVRAGDNLGWGEVFGCETRSDVVEPVMVWRNAMPPAGAAIYTGTAIPEWTGSLMVGTLGFSSASGRHLHRIKVDPNNPYRVEEHEVYLQNEYGRIRAVVMGPDGHLYLTTSNCDGRARCPLYGDMLLRIVGAD